MRGIPELRASGKSCQVFKTAPRPVLHTYPDTEFNSVPRVRAHNSPLFLYVRTRASTPALRREDAPALNFSRLTGQINTRDTVNPGIFASFRECFWKIASVGRENADSGIADCTAVDYPRAVPEDINHRGKELLPGENTTESQEGCHLHDNSPAGAASKFSRCAATGRANVNQTRG